MAVYPRLRGGSLPSMALALPIPGLSPPTRGIPRTRALWRGCRRSIPAYAGDPRASVLSYQLLKVYPRLRGGSFIHAVIPYLYGGLSPPTRGIHRDNWDGQGIFRSIPAYAGDPSPYDYRPR